MGIVLWSAQRWSGGAVLFRVEAQSTHDRNMAVRMMTLTGMSYEGIATSLEADGRLPAVLSIVLYTGGARFAAAQPDVGAGAFGDGGVAGTLVGDVARGLGLAGRRRVGAGFRKLGERGADAAALPGGGQNTI